MGKGNHNSESLPGTSIFWTPGCQLSLLASLCLLLGVHNSDPALEADLGHFITSVPGLPEGLADAVGVEIRLLKQLIKGLEGASCDLSPLIDVAKNRSQKPHFLKKQSHTRIRGET